MAFTAQWVCRECGKSVPKDKAKDHDCLLSDFVAHQKKLLENRIEDGMEQFLTPRERKKLAFERWCIQHERL